MEEETAIEANLTCVEIFFYAKTFYVVCRNVFKHFDGQKTVQINSTGGKICYNLLTKLFFGLGADAALSILEFTVQRKRQSFNRKAG